MAISEQPASLVEGVGISEGSDLDRACTLYGLIASGGPDERMEYFVFPGNPVSKHRARFSKANVYSAPGQKEAELTLGWAFRAAVSKPFRGNVAVGCIFFRQTQQPVDVDNLLKHVLDSAKGIAFLDDRQVTSLAGMLEYDADRPRTVIVIGRHSSSMVRDTIVAGVCEFCETPISHPSWRKTKQRFCSSACVAKSRGQDLSEPMACAHCKKPFQRRNSYQVLCSAGCRIAWLTARKREEAHINYCVDCNAELPRRGFTGAKRCRSCWKKARADGMS